ncbi:VWA domain-containing protein [Dysgonomonas sp. GY75]|uniref:vWA domain-containing protein n=1 Tax=Dysgonomonas sp. GY75 TaxID=2780419 RepID=UPI00188331C8|nr:VWA domain-containing protein [Dysgonomonas sp. GY75]MBF0649709.1 VWA domain-containing protein [Dysgonomonas sp. GY75]
MKTSAIGLIILSGIFMFSCNTKTKTESPNEQYTVIETQPEQLTELTPPSPPMTVQQKFVPPTISKDEAVSNDYMLSQNEIQESQMQISVADVKGSDDKQAADIAELREHKAIVAEVPVAKPFIMAESPRYDRQRNEEYSQFTENKFKMAREEPLSTFSVDVDAASYSNMRRFINRGELPYKDAVRIEELINYFSYDYAEPAGNDPVRITTEVGSCPWNSQNRLVKVGLKAKSLASDNLPASNFVFLIDVSGSMSGPTRLDLVKSSLKLLVNNLRKKDRVAIVVYASSTGEVLPSTSGENKQKIKEALNNLSAGGSTAGGAGIQLAYKIAKQNFIKGGNNRIILCTDGDFNVGVSSNEGLQRLIENERKTGVFLSILGYGMGNYKDSKMQTLAQAGNGNHAYIDNLQEANKVLVNEFGATMYTVAKDVKLQIEFNPNRVQAYRLVGYETRMLNKEDFNDDTKDAGEMGAGHTVTAFYEVVPVGVKMNMQGNVDPLKYQTEAKNPIQKRLGESMHPDLLTVKLRYKQPNGSTSKKIEVPLIDSNTNEVSDDFRFAAAVAMFGQVMKDSEYKGEGTFDKAIELAQSGYGNDSQGYRREFVRLMETAKGLTRN